MTAPRRRTQEEQSAETRALLLDTTIECLAELGYQRTTSQVVADRAGLSRGAQLHHFGSKAQLVTAAMEHLFRRRREEFERALRDTPRDERMTTAAIDLLWSMVSGPVGSAYLELVAAARTDSELRAAMIDLTHRMDEGVDDTFRALFGQTPGVEPDVLWTALFALLEGLAFEKVVRPGDRRVDEVLTVLKELAPAVLTPRRP